MSGRRDLPVWRLAGAHSIHAGCAIRGIKRDTPILSWVEFATYENSSKKRVIIEIAFTRPLHAFEIERGVNEARSRRRRPEACDARSTRGSRRYERIGRHDFNAREEARDLILVSLSFIVCRD
ncbi:hypothetical protein EZV77_02235 [Burkholderia thailandensis]|nr:hypothetical protein A8H32_30555 [Burkholderia thailandensis]MDD1483801.1 hypothetical protein [Burkholderia thailandensis]MDD1490001.1 hypothetical protein [Burkholderia thailandensis]MDD1495928.1 hypothetical protein [Burkholderia thailandensis]MDW9234701.1 hypothetical protein [Burkholderia thailandensis]